MRRKRNITRLGVLIGIVAIIGCSRPQASPQNLQLISSLRTAASTQDAELLEQNATLLEERREAAGVTDAEYKTFQKILDLGRAGKWEEAERETIAFQKAQRPTVEQVQRVKDRQIPRHDHDHDHGHAH